MSTISDDSLLLDDDALRLAAQLDAASPLSVRDVAIAEAIMRAMVPVTELIRKQVSDPHMREDLAQETWAEFTDSVKSGRFQNRGIDPTHYIMKIAHNRVRHYFARDPQHRHIEVPLPTDDLLEMLATVDDIADAERRFELDTYFNTALLQMTKEEQFMAQLWRHGWTVPDIAQRTNLKYRQAWLIIQRMIKLMQRAADE